MCECESILQGQTGSLLLLSSCGTCIDLRALFSDPALVAQKKSLQTRSTEFLLISVSFSSFLPSFLSVQCLAEYFVSGNKHSKQEIADDVQWMGHQKLPKANVFCQMCNFIQLPYPRHKFDDICPTCILLLKDNFIALKFYSLQSLQTANLGCIQQAIYSKQKFKVGETNVS